MKTPDPECAEDTARDENVSERARVDFCGTRILLEFQLLAFGIKGLPGKDCPFVVQPEYLPGIVVPLKAVHCREQILWPLLLIPRPHKSIKEFQRLHLPDQQSAASKTDGQVGCVNVECCTMRRLHVLSVHDVVNHQVIYNCPLGGGVAQLDSPNAAIVPKREYLGLIGAQRARNGFHSFGVVVDAYLTGGGHIPNSSSAIATR